MYGLESAQLNEPEMNILDKFHLRALRKVIRMSATFINRGNANEEDYKRPNERIGMEGRGKDT